MDGSTNTWTFLIETATVYGKDENHLMVVTNRFPTEKAAWGHFAARIREDRALQKLNQLAKDVAGLYLVVLLRVNRQMVELHPAGGETGLPLFCRVYRRATRGLESCRTCRSLVAFGACYRGLIEYACHGGVSVIAAPALWRDGTVSSHVVVASCAFAGGAHARCWPLARDHARNLGADMTELRRAFCELPVVTEKKRQTARDITEVAALVLGDIEERIEREYRGGARATGEEKPRYAAELEAAWSALGLARDPSFTLSGHSAASAMADMVVAMVMRDPSVPYSVVNIARAARVTPNHFSTIFRKHTGQTFQAFLNEQRIARARDLLQNPSLDIAEVAHASGFADPAYFSRRFKQTTGCTPTAWRAGRPRLEGEAGPPDATGGPSGIV